MKRLFTRRTAGTDAKVDRLVMEYARRSAASPLLQHTERLVLDRSEGIAHLSSVGKHTAERRCSLPSAAARLLDTLPQGLLSPPLASGTDDAAARYALTLRWSDGASQRITGRYDCTGLPDGWAELAAEADTLLRFYTEGELFDPSRAAAAPGRCFTAPWNSSRTAHATPTAPKTGRWRPVSLWSFRPGRMRTSCWAGSSRCRPARPRTHPTRPRRQNRFSAAPPRRIFWSSANSCKDKAGPDAAFRCRIGSFLRFTILLPGRSSPVSGSGS